MRRSTASCQDSPSSAPQAPTFVHLTRSWRFNNSHLNQDFETPKDQSEYWKGKLRLEWAREGEASLKSNCDEMVAQASGSTLPDELAPLVAPMVEKMVQSLDHKAKYAMELLKEYIFDEIRLAEFPKLPSRRRCMFLFADCHSPADYAQNLGLRDMSQYSVVRVLPSQTASIHVADMRFLNCNGCDHDGLAEAARKYWSPADSASIHSEVLLEGRWKLVGFTPPQVSQGIGTSGGTTRNT